MERGKSEAPTPYYEVTTIKVDRDGNKSVSSMKNLLQRPNEFKDLTNSMKMLD